MGISINSANVTPLAGPDSALNLTASALSLPTSPDTPSAVTITAVDPQDHSRLDKYLKALGAPLQMGIDAQNIANALVPIMQSLIKERPDLASTQFDFSSDSGTIAVTSKTMSDADKTWLQTKLNSDGSLVQAVRSFHDDAVAGYATWAEADGDPLSPSESDAVSKQADGLTSFMDLFKNLGTDAQAYLMTGGTYHTPNGAKMDFSRDPGSATGFLSFMQSVQSASDGTATFTTSSGQSMYGVLRMNIFEMNSQAMPNFFPPSETRSLGVDETA
ncbi:hypothetical protein PQQ51_12430 [Paraburkholderia xenovorans]|uniref:hypothetical protein n=1 Tax=Paraburkholderia xenovorans TaxID=36873 RepID=UPI0038BB347D